MPSTDAFEKLVALLDYPMYVVTTRADGQGRLGKPVCEVNAWK